MTYLKYLIPCLPLFASGCATIYHGYGRYDLDVGSDSVEIEEVIQP